MGLVGGGPDAFIGNVHRMASRIDGQIELVCGAFSSSAEKSKAAGQALFLDPARSYAGFDEMFAEEAKLPSDQRMEFVGIVTPNHLHFPIAAAALKHGFHVMCEKPATFTLAECLELEKIVNESGLLFGVTHTYTGYPLVTEARERVARGDLGDIVKVVAEYNQGWLAGVSDDDAGKQAAWRMDPERAGISCCMGDIGVHAANLAETITGLEIKEVLADLGAVQPGRRLDDDGSVMLRFNNGARGLLFASQISVGEENNLKIRVYGTKAGLEWHQQDPNTLWIKHNDKPTEMLRAGMPYLSEAATAGTRTPPGHPEGYLEAFGNLYKDFATAVREERGKTPRPGIKAIAGVPGIEDAVAGMKFIETVVKSSDDGNVWRSV